MYTSIFIVFAAFAVSQSLGFAIRTTIDDDLAPEDVPIRQGLQYIAAHPEIVQDFLTRLMTAQELSDIQDDVTSLWQPTELDDQICQGCVTLVETATVAATLPYVIVEATALQICPVILGQAGLDADIMCRPIIKNYGRAIYDIAKGNPYGARGFCDFFNYCVPQTPGPLEKHLSEMKPAAVNAVPHMSQSIAEDKKRDLKTDNILKIAQFTDVHVDEDYLEGSKVDCNLLVCCHGDYPGEDDSRAAGPFGQYNCNVPPSTLQNFIQLIANMKPDIVLNTGDNPPHHLWLETLDGMMNVTSWVAKTLIDAHPKTPIYSTLGNHENFPSNLYYVKRAETEVLLDVFSAAYGAASKWSPEQYETFSKGGYYTVEVEKGLRLISYNSNFGYTDNWFNVLNYQEPEPTEMIEWIRQTLQMARDNSEKVLLIAHHPLGEGVIEFDRAVSEVVVEYGDVIVLYVCGHKHQEHMRVLSDSQGRAKSLQLLSQSSNTYDTVNPGVRMYYLDRDTLELLDYEQYFLDIKERETASIKLSYRASEEYGLSKITPESMQDLANRMRSDEGLFNKYNMNIRTKARDSVCSGDCRLSELCRMVTSSMDAYRQCVANRDMEPLTRA